MAGSTRRSRRDDSAWEQAWGGIGPHVYPSTPPVPLPGRVRYDKDTPHRSPRFAYKDNTCCMACRAEQ